MKYSAIIWLIKLRIFKCVIHNYRNLSFLAQIASILITLLTLTVFAFVKIFLNLLTLLLVWLCFESPCRVIWCWNRWFCNWTLVQIIPKQQSSVSTKKLIREILAHRLCSYIILQKKASSQLISFSLYCSIFLLSNFICRHSTTWRPD